MITDYHVTTSRERKIYILAWILHIKRMVTQPKLNPVQEREVTLLYFCGIETGHIQKKYPVSEETITRNIVGKRSREWNDPSVEFYRGTDPRDKGRKATHLYLIFNGQTEGLDNVNLIDLDIEKPVYDSVDEIIFTPKTKGLIKETNLERVLKTPESGNFSPEKIMLREIFGSFMIYAYNQALRIVTPMIYGRLKEAYQQDSRLDIDAVYRQVAEDVFGQLRQGLRLVQNPQIVQYAQTIEEEKARKSTILLEKMVHIPNLQRME